MNIQPSLTRTLSGEGVNYAPQIVSAAQRHGIDPALLAAVAAQETGGPGSNGGRNILGDGGHGHGLFQIDDRWHDFARTAASMDPAQNADYAANMIAGLLKQYGGDVHKALSAYNAGSPSATGTKTAWGDGKVLGYADSVLRHYRQLSGLAAPAAGTPILEEARAQSADAFGSINQLFTLAQSLLSGVQSGTSMASMLAPPSAPAQSRSHTHSWAQMEGIDASGHTKQQTTYADLINGDAGDDNTGDSIP